MEELEKLTKYVGYPKTSITPLTMLRRQFEEDVFVTIEAEEGGQAFKISKAALLSTSDYFRKALNGNFAEASTGQIRLRGTDPDAVKLLAFWVYRQTIPNFAAEHSRLAPSPIPEHKSENFTKYCMPLIGIRVLADMLVLPKLQNIAMSQIVSTVYASHLSPKVLYEGYSRSPRNSKLSQLLIKQARYEYFGGGDRKCITSNDIEELAKIPGFTRDFVDTVGKTSEHFFYVDSGDEDEYMVEE